MKFYIPWSDIINTAKNIVIATNKTNANTSWFNVGNPWPYVLLRQQA